MAASSENKDRQVIPRWRTFREALNSGELSSAEVLKSPRIDATEFIREKEKDFKQNKAVPFALDLVSAATVLGKTEISLEAAEFILENGNDISETGIGLARSLLGVSEPSKPIIIPQSRIQVVEGLRQLKQKRIAQRKNPFVWVDLAQLYTLLGQNEQARQALRIALALAPSERFVVRCTVRFLHHINEDEEALRLLRKNPRTAVDPWLMAAEIAASGLAETSSRFAKIGGTFLGKADIHRYHTSELASALATLEMKAGKHRHSNKLFYESLKKPTANALAQAVWASKRAGLDQIDPELLAKARASEAITLDFFNRREWQKVIVEAENWSKEEGFSPRPHILASSVVASLLDRPAEGEEICRKGLEANPKNPILLNNKAFAQILQGKIDEADKTLSEVDLENTHGREKICLLATTGLAFFRSGKQEEGRQCYQKAISLAIAAEDTAFKVLASLYFAREEVLIGNKEGFKDFERAYQSAQKLKQSNLPAIAEHLAITVGKEAVRQDVPFEILKEIKPVFIEGDFFGPSSKAIVQKK